MNRTEILVPSGIKYISDWAEYRLPKDGRHVIVDKGVTGCGYTEFCLTNKENVVLCSPRKLLLENKRDQHKKDPNIYYLENDITNFSDVRSVWDKIRDHILFCTFKHLPVKIMVTYDSLHYVAEYLYDVGTIGDYIFVVDEFQSIFLDSYFKAEIESDFLESLQICPNVLYLSATPMLDKYLEKLPEFQNLEFQRLDWRETGFVETIVIKRRRVAALGTECGKIIEKYLKGEFEYLVNIEGKVVESKEAVFYFNSVGDITKLLKKYGLTPENTSVICADTDDNKEKLKKVGFTIGKVPLKDEPNPMFMFCTSAIYMGIDLYSDNARSFVFADPNISSLALDISLDLPQIIGRQRDRNNPFKNEIVLFYKTRRGEKAITRDLFDEEQEKRRKETNNLLNAYQKLSEEEQSSFINKIKRDSELYLHDFISISKNTNLPVYNHLIDIANERAWEVSQEDYQDKITVTKALEEQGFIGEEYLDGDEEIANHFLDTKFYLTNNFEEKMKYYCDFCDKHSDNKIIMNTLLFKIKDQEFRVYYNYFGTSGCKARGYKRAELQRSLKNAALEDRLGAEILSKFTPGNKYTSKEIKFILSEIYKMVGSTKTAKAKDLENYFTIVRSRVLLPDGTIDNGFKITGVR